MGRESGKEGEWSVESYVRWRRLIGDVAPTGNGEATSFTFPDSVAFKKKKEMLQVECVGGTTPVSREVEDTWIAMETAASG